MRLRLSILAILIIAAGVVPFFYEVGALFDEERIRTVIAENYVTGVLLYLVLATGLKLLFTPALPTSVAAGYLFGGPAGAVIALISIVLSAVIPFSVTKYLGAEVMQRLIVAEATGRLHRYSTFIERHGLPAVVFFRAVPVLPNMVVNIGFGLTHVPLRTFLAGTLIGVAPGAILLAYIGANITNYTDPLLYVLVVLYVLLVAIGIAGAYWFRVYRGKQNE